MKYVYRAVILTSLLLICFAISFQAGRTIGFRTGSEWALMQAKIIAREAGLFMPVYLEGDNFRVVLKQPRGLYRKAWRLADRHDESRPEDLR